MNRYRSLVLGGFMVLLALFSACSKCTGQNLIYEQQFVQKITYEMIRGDSIRTIDCEPVDAFIKVRSDGKGWLYEAGSMMMFDVVSNTKYSNIVRAKSGDMYTMVTDEDDCLFVNLTGSSYFTQYLNHRELCPIDE